jgi:DNA (cytosine-5)-methyltransferase 1
VSLPSGPTSTHLFCGAGGDSDGFRRAGFLIALGANHWARAIETHTANFPHAEHLCIDLDHYDMRRLPRTDVLVGSPICTEASPADGQKRRTPPTPGQLELEEQGHVPDAAWERTRATAYDILRAVEVHQYKAVVCENVVRFITKWPLFYWWLGAMEILGYRHQIVSVSAAHIDGGEANPCAPQWRDRIFVVFTRRTMRAPDLTLSPRAYCFACEQDVDAFQSWRNGRKVGKYRQQYDYRCPSTRCRHAVVEPYVRPAAAAIDWSDIGSRIADRPRTKTKPEGLRPATLAKIRLGLARHRVPTVITVSHTDPTGRPVPAHAAPLATRTVKIGDGFAVPPMLVPVGGSWNSAGWPVTVPMRTRTTTESEGLLVPFITEHRGGGSTTRGIDHPLATITAGGNHHGLVIPYRKTSPATSTGEPIHTIATHQSAGVVLGADSDPAEIDVQDCYFRMLNPREHLRAQRFADEYVVLGNVGEQTAQAGNAVPANVAQWIGQQLLEVLR